MISASLGIGARSCLKAFSELSRITSLTCVRVRVCGTREFTTRAGLGGQTTGAEKESSALTGFDTHDLTHEGGSTRQTCAATTRAKLA
jgi:hypothetical protein